MKIRTQPILTLLLIGLVGLISLSPLADQGTSGSTSSAVGEVEGDEYGSIPFSRLGLSPSGDSSQSGGQKRELTITGVTIDFTAEVNFAPNGFLYFPQTNEIVGVYKINIKQGAGNKYWEVLAPLSKAKGVEKLSGLLTESRIQRESWRDHFMGNYYYRKATPQLQSIADLSKKREILFPALEKYKAAIRKDPAFPMPHLNLAYLYVELGEMERAAHECKLAEKYNWYDVPSKAGQARGEHTAAIGIIEVIDNELKLKIDDTAYNKAIAQFRLEDYNPESRHIHPEKDSWIKSDEKAQNMEIFVESMQKYLPSEERARLYHNLGYYYHTKGAYHLALQNYQKAFEVFSDFDEGTLEIISQNISKTYERLGWLEAEEIAMTKKNPFK